MIRRHQKKILLVFLLGIFFLLVFLLFLSLLLLKPIYSEAKSGYNNLNQAISLTYQKDFWAVNELALNAEENFTFVYNRLEKYQDIKLVKFLGGQKLDTGLYLAKTAEVSSQALAQVSGLMAEINDLMPAGTSLFANLAESDKQIFLQSIYESLPELNGTNASLKVLVNNFESYKLPWFLKGKSEAIKEKLSGFSSLLDKAVLAGRILPDILGYPKEATYLLIFQNNHELRPTGGFIGSYGLLSINNGKLNELRAEDVYHLDMPAIDKLTTVPPQPLKDYLQVEKWYFRDGNWSPDWPTSSKQLISLYNQETADQLSFNGVIAITPQVVADVLNFVGPIMIDNEEYNSENFHELLQYKTGREYWQEDISFWDRKEIIKKITEEIKLRILALPKSEYLQLLNIADKGIKNKDILIYLTNTNSQEAIVELGADGSLRETIGNYLMVVDSNMAAYKTDAVMEKTISYDLSESYGTAKAVVTINYKHNGDFDWRTTRYRTYTRIYVPLGSKLIKTNGNSNDDVYQGEELNKQVFGTFISIEPRQEKTLTFEFELPLLEDYSFYVQKQPGAIIKEINLDLDYENNDFDYHFSGPFTQDISL